MQNFLADIELLEPVHALSYNFELELSMKTYLKEDPSITNEDLLAFLQSEGKVEDNVFGYESIEFEDAVTAHKMRS